MSAGSSPEIPTVGRVAGIDFGTVRVGVAITDPERILASPLENYNRRSQKLDRQYFQQLAQEERIALFVVGLPVHMSGAESGKSGEARKFGQWLGEITGVPVVYYDERFTTSIAKDRLAGLGVTKQKKKQVLDKLAAQILLTSYLENPARADAGLDALDD
ncbi:Holliday junction resolvase RuvX [Blastopirellula marina]|uniref:Putative pre-16S rRNA nuclease n=1 Tax=Blastopirellula marina TaxID=124 RepID=A0A2S8GSB6_9BACT|nr:Holliday junction resolvase RuvX [Blastopirellula marina]PQO36434.1 Holliday junction resolvase RuvX [Blastopirellula marina]PQO47316.1 Holliday junction resolvase RuvX [Blastopirellula marina]PTL44271.1 Holliday junction resolvase RuvX [Blastopirellula marina]